MSKKLRGRSIIMNPDLVSDEDKPLYIRSADGDEVVSIVPHIDATNGDLYLLARKGRQSSVTPANADGYLQMAAVPPGGIPT